MNLRPTRTFISCLCFVGTALLLILSCSKDRDIFLDAVLEDEVTTAVEQDSTVIDQNEEETSEEEESNLDEEVNEELESRITVFSTTNDAYLQNGNGFDQDIIRLQENFRRSYLMFDLRQIDSIGGNIISASLELTINGDAGNGKITVYKGVSNDWTEDNLSEKSAPEISSQLGQIEQNYKIGDKVSIELEVTNLVEEVFTLILDHRDGDDLAFASKESTSKIGPKLAVVYDAPISAETIVVLDEQIIEEETTEEETTEEETTEGDGEVEEEVNAPPKAIAEATPANGVVPLEVTFTGVKSTDDKAITAYEWNFQDGATGSTVNTIHTFTEPGSYDVQLKVTDAEGLNSTTTIAITVNDENNEVPVARASASVQSGIAPLEVDFSGSNSTDDNAITSYNWDFKDGATSNQANPSHTFNSPGTYTVELTVKDGNGLSDTSTVLITIAAINEAPIAVATANIVSGEVPLQVNFTGINSTDDNSIASYNWDFKDGATSSQANSSHTFNSPGTYTVELTVKDEDGLSDTSTVLITTTAPANEAPTAVVTTNIASGEVPLQINFTGSNSSDDNAITSYTWDFKDGTTSSQANPSHTFNSPGTYAVELTVKDEDGLSDTNTVLITTTAPANEGPIAVATANTLIGTAPLQVNFTGSNSTDDNGIVGYHWNFPGNSSSAPNATHTFNDPGVYDVTLTVTDEAGLEDTAILTITVNQESVTGQIPCGAGGGTAGQTGAKIWCWKDVDDVPTYNGISSTFQNGQLAVHTECNPDQVSKVGDRLRFHLDPTTPAPQQWCNNKHNMRVEVTTSPWEINHPKGTEEWLGWSYTFGDDYSIDTTSPWLFYQVHHAVIGDSPHLELLVGTDGLYGGSAGEIIVRNTANNNDYRPTGVIPRAGETVDIVVHAVWGDASNGLLQVWLNGKQVYNKQVRTVYSHHEYGGNSKFGIYKWYWREDSGVDNSAAIGINSITTYMGPLRIITRRPGGADYLKDSYSTVAPN